MIDFKTLLDQSCVAIDPDIKDKAGAISFMVNLLHAAGKIAEPEKLIHEMLEREKLVSTGVGEGVAIPHALSDSVGHSVMAVCRLKTPIDFGSPDGVPVSIIIMTAGPREATAMHLKILSKMARLFHDAAFRSAFERAPSGEALARLLYEA